MSEVLSPYFMSSVFFPSDSFLCFFLSMSLFLYPAGMAGDLTPSWWSRRPLLEPSSRSTSGRRVLDFEWSFVYCFSKRGPSHLSQVPLRPGPQCPIVPAKSPGFRPDLCNTFLPNSNPSVRFSSAHKGILSYCPHFRRDQFV